MKATAKKRPLTLGDFVAGGYDAWGERRALGLIRLAIQLHLIKRRAQ